MGTAKSRMKKVAPVSVTEENVCSSGGRRDGSQLFGPSNTQTPDRRVSVRRRAQGDCNSDGQDSELSADDLAVEVDRILAECDNNDITLNRTSYMMPIFGAKSSGLYYAKDSNNVYSGNKHGYVTRGHKPTSNIHEKVRPLEDRLSCANIESTATASGYGIVGGSSLALPIMYDASEEDLMNTIEREFR
ncbi:hypothetical protein DPX16_19399 [Anabarilius grahami]|uniref:Uncharacterized protein n=1 Tax=Anabarilius grahami TaxID=495550 RepID=A0A3N0Z0A8_ANAGA|nr:hypothetical protein DPX16_19399 [Anabarilius grahami]